MKILFHFLFAAILVLPAISQTQADATIPPEEKKEKLEQAAVTLLRETYGDVGNLRSLENRISFTAELAALLWYKDQKAGAAMFGSVVDDFKQLIAIYDGQLNNISRNEEDIERLSQRYSPPMTMPEPNQLTILRQKLRTVAAVRQQIALSIAEHEPELAFNFFYDSLNSVTNPYMQRMLSGSDTYFEATLLERVASTNAAKATEIAKKQIEKDGIDYRSLGILKKVYEKDADKGIELGATLLRSIRGKMDKDKAAIYEFSYLTSSLFDYAIETKESAREKNRKPLFEDAEIRELAEIVARRFLDSEGGSIGEKEIAAIEKFLPGRAVQIKTKKRQIEAQAKAEQNDVPKVMEEAMASAEAAAKRSAEYAKKAEEESKEQERLENEFRDGALKLDQKDLPQEEREKILARARDLLSKTPGREKQIMGLSMLAAQVRKAGDQRLASELMREAASLVTTDPRNYQDFMFTWILIAGYAEADPDRAFPLLEDSIMRANEVIASALRVAEFVDVTGELMENGEFLLGAFGGNMIRGLTSEAKIAEVPLRTLSQNDLERLKSIANRVERPEARVLAKILILRATIGNQGSDGVIETTTDRK